MSVVAVLRFRLRHGFWCRHTYVTPWIMVDLGELFRVCHGCGRVERR